MTGQAKRSEDSYLLPTAMFNHMMEIAIIQATEHITKQHLTGYIPVAYLALLEPTDASTHTLIALMPDFDIERRYELMQAFGDRMAADDKLVMAIIFVSEAWRSTYPGEKMPKEYPMPRDDPKRIECITAIGQTVEGRYAMSYLDIKRDRKDNMMPLETTHVPYDENAPNDAQSDLLNAFWQGYRRSLRDKLMSDPDGKAMIEKLNKKASGSTPEAHGFKYN